MNPVSEQVKDLLVAGGAGTFAGTSGWSIYINDEPTTPDTVITIYDAGGSKPQPFADHTLYPVEDVEIQLRVRARAFLTVCTKLETCINILEGAGRFDDTEGSDSVHYLMLKRSGAPIPLGKDEDERFIITQNFRVLRQRTA